ncbi:MAG: molybdenum hydroxylase [Anaeromicrobium sp.]|jgi:xanthine dehydrogenase accessory factor|uniref:molybdenum hydroxylase n=1 Tax=Anaeromicrobium sp. TaxID=1929132 RepID=UPI0025E7E2F7|nr:molybdenum hydroxylase [Anaeromicrobium sp.]MCT4593882.1 molybdenum hydroxylase [Anaeromicrobium sp.]
MNRIVGIRGGGPIATAIGCHLYKSGFRVIIFEKKKPTTTKRKVSFAEAVYEKEVRVEGVLATLTDNIEKAIERSKDHVSVLIDEIGRELYHEDITIVIDSILANKNFGTNKIMGKLVIGIGSGFMAGEDVHAIINPNRGSELGRISYEGTLEKIEYMNCEYEIKANNNGRIKVLKDIGNSVKKGDIIAYVGEDEIVAHRDGIISGMIRNNFKVEKDMEIAYIDPHDHIKKCINISSHGRVIGTSVFQCVCVFLNKYEI